MSTKAAISSQPLAVRTTVQAASEWLRAAIMRGDFKPGERLVEHRLATALGIGQPTLREALKELELTGFVRKTPKKGTHVTLLSKQDFWNIQEVRMALESVAVRRAAARMTPQAVERLEECVRGMRMGADNFSLAEFHRNDLEFHRTLWALSDNAHLKLALERVAFGLFAFVLLQSDETAVDEFRASVRQHEEILEGVRSGDPDRAVEVFTASTTRFWNENHQVVVGQRERDS